MGEPASLKVSDVHKDFVTPHDRVEVLRGISFDMAAGESLAITGPSGSGKSTLLHLIGTLEEPTSGEILIDGQNPFTLPEVDLARFRNRNVGFVFQEHHLLPQYSVLENVLVPTLAFPHETGDGEAGDDPEKRARELLGRVGLGHRATHYPMQLSGGADPDPEKRARELLERGGLGHRLEHRPAELSGGEKQRAAVARALINGPHVLLCDEPTGSLDQATAATVAELLMELHQAEQTILVIATHSLELARGAARRFELKEGRCSAV